MNAQPNYERHQSKLTSMQLGQIESKDSHLDERNQTLMTVVCLQLDNPADKRLHVHERRAIKCPDMGLTINWRESVYDSKLPLLSVDTTH